MQQWSNTSLSGFGIKVMVNVRLGWSLFCSNIFFIKIGQQNVAAASWPFPPFYFHYLHLWLQDVDANNFHKITFLLLIDWQLKSKRFATILRSGQRDFTVNVLYWLSYKYTLKIITNSGQAHSTLSWYRSIIAVSLWTDGQSRILIENRNMKAQVCQQNDICKSMTYLKYQIFPVLITVAFACVSGPLYYCNLLLINVFRC